jgi:hypothetical protein
MMALGFLIMTGWVLFVTYQLGRLNPVVRKDTLRVGDTVATRAHDHDDLTPYTSIQRVEGIDRSIEGHKLLALREIARLPVI